MNAKKLDTDLMNIQSPLTKPLIEEPLKLELQALPSHLWYVFFSSGETLPVIVVADLLDKFALVIMLSEFNKAIGWTIVDIIRIPSGICSYKINLIQGCKPNIEKQRKLNPPMQEVVKKEHIKSNNVGALYLISYSNQVNQFQYIIKEGGLTIIKKQRKLLVSARLVTMWRVCMDHRLLNSCTK